VIDCITTQIDVTATGGGTYDWGGGVTTAANSFTTAGTYTVTVTGANGCTATESITITEDIAPPTAGITNNTGSTVIDCITTQIDVTATGGGTYDWGGGVATAANSFAAAGTYTVTVTGANGCTATESITITEDITPPTAGITNNTGTTVIDCNTSQIDVTATGGGTYDWGGGVTTAANSFTTAGNYTVTVSSSNGCTSSDNIIITEDLTPPTSDAGLDQSITCAASTINLDGSASSSGPEFTYTWTTASGNIINGANTPIPNVDAAGTYTLLVTNTNNGCTASDQVNITEDFVAPIASAGTDQELTCLNPTLNLDGSGSTSGSTIDYAWNTADGNIVSGTNTENPLIDAGGTYTILVTDTNNGCTASDAVLVTESFNNPTADAGIDATINCYNPTISLDATGSSTGAQFEYQWDGPTDGIISGGDGLSPTIAEAGTYSLTVTDISNACFAVDDVEVFGSFSQPSVLAGADQVLTCANLTVDLDGTGSDSGSDYDFNWTTTDGNILSGQNTLVPTVNQAGTYELTILNLVNGCEHSDQVIVTENTTPPIADAGIDMEITCENTSVTLDGSASATGADYSYLWTTTNGNILSGETSIYPTVNASGTYTLTVINNLSACTSTDEVTVLEFTTLPIVSAGEDQELTCAITSLNLDGTGSDSGSEFNILWTSFDGNIVSGQNSTTPLVNEPGTYLCTITNSLNGCQNSDEVIITENIVPPIANAGSDSEIPCGNSTITLDGSLSSIGTEFSYAWSTSNGSFVSGVNSLNSEVNSEGDYQLLVTNNSNGCTASDEVSVVESNGLNVSAATNNVSCYGYNDGSIHLTVTGGTEPYSVNWQNGSAGASVTNLASGWYVYEIADALLCSTTDSVFISQPSSPVLFSANLENISCYSEADGSITVNVSGGTQPYEYQWQDQGSVIGNASRVQNLDEGIYQLQITDANNCQIDSLFMITQPSPITVGYTSQGPSCIGNTDGYIDLEVVGGVEPYTFYWGEFTGNLPYLDGLMEGSYTVSVTDANSCNYSLGTIVLMDNPEECLRIPNAFSPNGDGTNDTWIIENLELFNNYQVEVFNRWGQVLYIGYPGADPWDGKTTEGKSVPTGSYVYIVNLFNGSEPKSGIVTIVY
jgi:gliding motility-associated-like protein